jgi:type II secretory pathway component PulM
MRRRVRHGVESILKLIVRLVRPLYQPIVDRVRPIVEPAAARIRARYDRLEPREKTLVLIASALGAVWVAHTLVYAPIQGLRQDLRERIETRQHEVVEVRRQVQTYRRLKLDLAAAEKHTVPQKDFSLFSALEGMLTKSVGVAKIGSITPGEDKKISKDLVQHSVDITLQNVSLADVVDTLYGIKTLPVPVIVSSLHVKKAGQLATVYQVEITCIALGKTA